MDSRYSAGFSRMRSRSLGSRLTSLCLTFSLSFCSFRSVSAALYPDRRHRRRFRAVTRLYAGGFAARSFYPSTLSLRKRSAIPHRVVTPLVPPPPCSFFSAPFSFSTVLLSLPSAHSFSPPHERAHRHKQTHARALSLALSPRLFPTCPPACPPARPRLTGARILASLRPPLSFLSLSFSPFSFPSSLTPRRRSNKFRDPPITPRSGVSASRF